METLYQFSSQEVGRTSAFAPSSRSNDAHFSDEAQNYNGILEGGNWIDNTFFTANIGVGVERYLSGRMSVFFQPPLPTSVF